MNWWKRQPGVAKAFYIIVAAILVLAITGLIANLVMGKMIERSITTDIKAPGESNSDTSAPFKPTSEPESEAGEEETDDEQASVGIDQYTFKIDNTGMLEMPVTTDPREAAAAAAALAFTVEFDNYTHEEFMTEAMYRMTHPTESYKGPEGEIHTLWWEVFFEGRYEEYYAPEYALWKSAELGGAFKDDKPSMLFWMFLAKRAIYNAQAQFPGHSWVGTPIQVLSTEEMRAIDPELVPQWRDYIDLTPKTPGATVSEWWVLVDVEGAAMQTAQPQTQFATMFGVWCDAPEDGGVCAVAYPFTGPTPDGWPSAKYSP